MEQDKQGFMWFGGEGGLARYDGYNVKLYRNVYNRIDSLVDNRVRDLFVDRNNMLWIATQSGLSRLDLETDQFTRFIHRKDQPGSLSHSVVWAISEDKYGKLWFATMGGGLNRFDPQSGLFQHYKNEPGNPKSLGNNYIVAITFDSEGDLWLGTRDGGVDRFDPETQTFEHYRHNKKDPGSISDDGILSLYSDSVGITWVGTYKGLNRFDPEHKRFDHYRYQADDPNGLSSDIIRNMEEDSHGNLWIATDGGGLNRFNRKTNTFQRENREQSVATGLDVSKVRTVFNDRDGNLWVGYFPVGIAVSNRYTAAFTSYYHQPNNSNSLSHSSVLSIEEDTKGHLWIGTEKGLNHLNRETGKIIQYRHEPNRPDGLAANPVLSLLNDEDERYLWAGMWRGGLSRMDKSQGTFEHFALDRLNPNSSGGSEVWSLYRDSSGQLWVGTDNGLHYYNAEQNLFERYKSGDIDDIGRVISIFEDSQEGLWIGGDLGLSLIDRELGTSQLFQHIPDELDTISANSVRNITEDEFNNIWLATWGGGVNRWDRKTGKFKAYRNVHGLAEDTVTAMSQDSQGFWWFATGSGLSRFNPRTAKFLNYDRRHGLPGDTFNRTAVVKTSRGELVFGSSQGLIIINPLVLDQNVIRPPVVITDFQLFNKSVKPGIEGSVLERSITWTRDIVLTHRQSVFSFEFSALNYRIAQMNQYQYKMDGFDKEWIESNKQRSVTYTNLDPGEYIFQVKASNNEGLWNEQGASIRITILPPWWRTWWAYTVVVLFMLSLLFWFMYVQAQKVNFERKNVEQERRLVLRLQELDRLKDEFLANTSHELRTPLHGIIGLTESLINGVAGKPNQAMRDNLELIVSSGKRLGNMVNDILDFSHLKNKSLRLACKPVDFSGLVNIVLSLSEQLIGEKRLRINNNVPESLPLVDADEDRLQQILYNLVGNAIKFTDSGSVTVTAEIIAPANLSKRGLFGGLTKENHSIQSRGDDANEHCLLVKVSDTGIGIPDVMHAAIFESFDQVQGAADREYSGTGLGLAVTRRLVHLHGGEIGVQSGTGAGACFYFTLPLAREEAVLAQKSARRRGVRSHTASPLSTVVSEHKGAEAKVRVMHSLAEDEYNLLLDNSLVDNSLVDNGLTESNVSDKNTFSNTLENTSNTDLHILVVDDEPVNCRVLINHLRLEGYHVSAASSGAEALEKFDSGVKFDLILLDIMMPRMSGYEVCSVLREQYPAPELPIIFLTARNLVTDLVSAFNVGANDFITKPVAREELLARVRVHLQLLEASRKLEYKVQERTQELQERTAKLHEEHERLKYMQSRLVASEKMAGLGTLVAGMAHEINNPTNVAHVSVFNLERKLEDFRKFIAGLIGGRGDEDIERAFSQRFKSLFNDIKIMRSGTSRIKTLVEDLRTFSNIDDAKVSTIKLESSLWVCINLAKSTYRDQVDFHVEMADDIDIYCCPASLNQAFMNIIINACQSIVEEAPDGRKSGNSLKINAYKKGDMAIVAFNDTGCGMLEETQKRIFEPFFTTRDVGNGRGLGLSITYGVIEQHKGSISVSSKLGRGSTFTLSLPLTASDTV